MAGVVMCSVGQDHGAWDVRVSQGEVRVVGARVSRSRRRRKELRTLGR